MCVHSFYIRKNRAVCCDASVDVINVKCNRCKCFLFQKSTEQRKKIKEAIGFVPDFKVTREVAIATGKLAYPFIRDMAGRLQNLFPNVKVHVYEITNYFFGELITVSGLLTGQDLISQLQGQQLGEALLLPENILRSGEDVFLDDLTVADLEKTLQVPLSIVKSNGCEFIASIVNK